MDGSPRKIPSIFSPGVGGTEVVVVGDDVLVPLLIVEVGTVLVGAVVGLGELETVTLETSLLLGFGSSELDLLFFFGEELHPPTRREETKTSSKAGFFIPLHYTE